MIDVLYCSWNRKEYVGATLPTLIENTDWSLVRRLIVHDDASTDGADREAAAILVVRAGMEWHLIGPKKVGLRSPVAITNEYVSGAWRNLEPAEWFVKIDSDVMVPPGWLERLLQVVTDSPDVDLLGMSAGFTGNGDQTRAVDWKRAPHIGGVGLMKLEAFQRRPLPHPDGRFGFTQWQCQGVESDQLRVGWVLPDIRCFELDRLPLEPWMTLADKYRSLKWLRPNPFPNYDPEQTDWWAWAKDRL